MHKLANLRRAVASLGTRTSLAEDRFPPDLLDQRLVSNRLLECEVWKRINAYQLQNSHGDAVRTACPVSATTKSKESTNEDAYFARQQVISEGLERVRDERSRMVSKLNDISNSTTADQIRLALKRIAAVSRYEGRLYSARKRHVQGAPPRTRVVI
jgi:hypothetical protein